MPNPEHQGQRVSAQGVEGEKPRFHIHQVGVDEAYTRLSILLDKHLGGDGTCATVNDDCAEAEFLLGILKPKPTSRVEEQGPEEDRNFMSCIDCGKGLVNCECSKPQEQAQPRVSVIQMIDYLDKAFPGKRVIRDESGVYLCTRIGKDWQDAYNAVNAIREVTNG